MKYTYTCMLGISLCAAMLFTPVREAIVQGKPAQEAFSQPDILNSPEIMEGEEEPDGVLGPVRVFEPDGNGMLFHDNASFFLSLFGQARRICVGLVAA